MTPSPMKTREEWDKTLKVQHQGQAHTMTPAKNLTLRRNIYVTGKRTFGELFVEGEDKPIAVTLEPIYDPARATVSKSDTAIKAGRYAYVIQRSPKHGMSLRYKDVPGRYDVLMHAGNADVDTTACTLPGLTIGRVNKVPMTVRDSRAAMHRILGAITGTNDPVAQLGRTGWITIVDEVGK